MEWRSFHSCVPLRGRALFAASRRSRSPCRSSPSRVAIANAGEKFRQADFPNPATFWSRWLIDRAAKSGGSPLGVVDGDTINPGLAPFYDGALVPPAFLGDQTAWFEKTTTSAVEARRSTLLEFGPSLFNDWLAELPLAETLEDNDADLVAVYLLTPDVQPPRLPYILDILKPPRALSS